MRIFNALCFAAAALVLASCGKTDSAKKSAGDPCGGVKAGPPYLTQEQAVQACKNNMKFVGAPTKRSKIQVTNH